MLSLSKKDRGRLKGLLIRIEEELGDAAVYQGWDVFYSIKK